MSEKKFKMAKANPDNKTAKLEAQILFYAANAINDTIKKEEEDTVEYGEAQWSFRSASRNLHPEK